MWGGVGPSLAGGVFGRGPRGAPRLLYGTEKTTLPLLSTVRTSRNPRRSNRTRRSAIDTRVDFPALLTPRRSATCLDVIGAIPQRARRPLYRPRCQDGGCHHQHVRLTIKLSRSSRQRV